MLFKGIMIAFVIIAVIFGFVQIWDFYRGWKNHELEKDTSFWKCGLVGFVCLFFDVLGIGCFATITFFTKTFGLTSDKKLPGTLNVGTALSAPVFAILWFANTDVDPVTLLVLMVCATIGSYVGASIVSKLPEQGIRIGMGVAMIIVAFFIFIGQVNLMPVGGDAVGLTGGKLIVSALVMALLGALLTIGVGMFAPCMALLYLMGMNPITVFPILYASCAFVQPVASFRFIKEKAYDRKAAMAFMLFGFVGMFISYIFIHSIPLYALKWIVFGVVLYTGVRMFMSYAKGKKEAAA